MRWDFVAALCGLFSKGKERRVTELREVLQADVDE